MWLVAERFTKQLFLEVLFIIGSFAVWEAANIWIVEKPRRHMERTKVRKLMDTEIRFTVAEGNKIVRE